VPAPEFAPTDPHLRRLLARAEAARREAARIVADTRRAVAATARLLGQGRRLPAGPGRVQ
jgi:hypothetical protein